VLIKQAKTVKARISDSKPAGSDVQLLAEHAAKRQSIVGAHPMSVTNWQNVQTSLASLRKALG